MYKILILLILLLLGFCKEDYSGKRDCPEEIICTEEFRAVTLKILDSNNSPVVLDHFYSFNKSSGKVYNFEGNPSAGLYTVLTDAEMGDILREGSEIVFSGAINGQKVHQEFVIGHDCCHIVPISGESKLIFSPEQ